MPTAVHGFKSETVCLSPLPDASFKVHGRKQAPLGRSLCELVADGINDLPL